MDDGCVTDDAAVILGEYVDTTETVVEICAAEVPVECDGEELMQRLPFPTGQLVGMTKPHPVSGCGFGERRVGQCFSGPTWYSKTSPATAPMITTTRVIANQKLAVANPMANSDALAAMAIGQ